jgi:hypothetical protein
LPIIVDAGFRFARLDDADPLSQGRDLQHEQGCQFKCSDHPAGGMNDNQDQLSLAATCSDTPDSVTGLQASRLRFT